jgi:lipopolysaccharide export system protein LptA
MACCLYADAYLAEDRIYYSADSYKIDYDNEIIYANGHASFRKQDKIVSAERIIIYYTKGQKRAELYKNVVLLNETDGSRISGDYGEALYNEDIYAVEGNTVYADGDIEITSDRISTYKGEETRFSGNVRYSDGDYEIKAPILSIAGDEATFKSKSEALHVESGDMVYCDSISFNTKTEDAVFQDNVLYEQSEKEGEDSLLMKSDTARFFRESDTYIFLGNVFVLNNKFTAQSSVARYVRNERILNVSGNIVLQEGDKYTYCTSANMDENTEKTVLYNKVSAVLFDEMK